MRLTFGEVAERLKTQLWRVQRAYERGLPGLPAAEKVGRIRTLGEGDLPALRRVLQAAGYVHKGN